MAITYEEALATLEAMFGDPWTRDTLDAVLRHEKGHMENTCDRILSHGDKDPQALVNALQHQPALDEMLARQQQQQQQQPPPSSLETVTKPSRGTPTELPEDFLRVPGFKYPRSSGRRAGTGTTTSGADGGAATVMDDETLARMLQDELFSEELARNPDFAHLARSGGRVPSTGPPGQRRATASNATARGPNPMEGVNVMENLSSKWCSRFRSLVRCGSMMETIPPNIKSARLEGLSLSHLMCPCKTKTKITGGI